MTTCFAAKAQYPLPSTSIYGNLTVQDTVTFTGGYMPFSSNNLNFGYGDIPFIGAGGAYGDGVFVNGIGDWSALGFANHLWAAGYLSNGGISFIQCDTTSARMRVYSSSDEDYLFQTSLEIFSDTSISGNQSLFELTARTQNLGYVDIKSAVDTKLRLQLIAFDQFDQPISYLALDTEHVVIIAPEFQVQSDLTVEKFDGEFANFQVRGNNYNTLYYGGSDDGDFSILEIRVRDTSNTDYGQELLSLDVINGFEVQSTNEAGLRSTISSNENSILMDNSNQDTIMISNADGIIIKPNSGPPIVGDVLTAVNTRGVVEWQTPAYSSGTYTPTATSITNIASSTSRKSNWSKVGNIVTVAGTVTLTTSGNGSTELGLSLPVPSNFGTTYEASGNAIAITSAGHSAVIYSNVANDYVVLLFDHSGSTSSDNFRYTYSYEILE